MKLEAFCLYQPNMNLFLFEYSCPVEESRHLNLSVVFFQINVGYKQMYFVVGAGVQLRYSKYFSFNSFAPVSMFLCKREKL